MLGLGALVLKERTSDLGIWVKGEGIGKQVLLSGSNNEGE